MDEDDREEESNGEDITIYLNRSANSDEELAENLRHPVTMDGSRGFNI